MIKSKLIPTGELSLKVFENDQLIIEETGANLVVNGGLTNIARLLGGHASGKKISKVGIGTSGTATAVTDTTITGVFLTNVTATTYTTNTVRFDFEIGLSDANGTNIMEFGLFNDDTVLCARKVRSAAIVKTSLIRITGNWTLKIN